MASERDNEYKKSRERMSKEERERSGRVGKRERGRVRGETTYEGENLRESQ